MSSAARDNNLPLAGGEPPVSPAANIPTQTRTNENTPAPAVPAMLLPPANAHLAPSPVQDVDEDESITPKAVTPAAAAAVADPLGAAPEGASEPPNVDGQVNGGVDGATNGLANGRRGSADPLFVRRRAGTGVSDPVLSFPLQRPSSTIDLFTGR
jgi:hypothetical protein